MKKHKIILLTAILLAFAFLATSCNVVFKVNYGVKKPLPPPITERVETVEEVVLNSMCVLSWKAVDRADKYKVEVNGAKAETPFVLIDFNQMSGLVLPKDGKFNVKITSVPNPRHRLLESEPYSGVLTVDGQKQDLPQIKLKEKNVIAFTTDAKAADFKLTINNIVLNKADIKGNELRLTDIAIASDYQISLQSVSDGVYIKNSPITRYSYTYNAAKLRMPQVTNAFMDAGTLKFDSIDNAYAYKITDVLNNTYEVTENVVELGSRTMPKSIIARDSRPEVLLSEPQAEIRYFVNGNGTQGDPYQISTAHEFRYIEYYERQNIRKYYKLTSDVEFASIELAEVETGSNYAEVGTLAGVLDGGGHTISNIITKSVSGFIGLFESIAKTGEIKNLNIKNFKMKTWRIISGDGSVHPMGGSIGVITKDNYGLIDNVNVSDCSLQAEFDDISIAQNNYGTIQNIVFGDNAIDAGAEFASVSINNKGEIKGAVINQNAFSGKRNVAGVASFNYGTISDCVNNMVMPAILTEEVGGIVSWNEGIIKKCTNNKTVTSHKFAGGIAAKNGGQIIDCVNNGEIRGNYIIGGITSYNEKLAISVVANNTNRIENCLNTGVVDAIDVAGGIAAHNYNGFILTSKNSGSISTKSKIGYAGGIAGKNGVMPPDSGGYVNAGIYSCYNLGSVTGATQGGIAALNASYRYNTDGEPYVLQPNFGIYNCFSIGLAVVQKNNQVCDSYGSEALSEGNFMQGKSIVDKSNSKVTNFADDAFLNKLKEADGAAEIWKSGTTCPKLYWE